MASRVSNSLDDLKPIGVRFTPLEWARFCVRQFNVVDDWLGGATVCDPTAGEGAFAFALCEEAAALGRPADLSDLARLHLCERHRPFLDRFAERFRTAYGIDFPRENLVLRDVVRDDRSFRADWLVGNPPWANFSDLPAAEKEALKPFFKRAGLLAPGVKSLLGSSRVDLAALVIASVMTSTLERSGHAALFCPMSLFQNQGASSYFRRYGLIGGGTYAVRELFDFDSLNIFAGVKTRFGLARFERDAGPQYPVPYHLPHDGGWARHAATPYPAADSPLLVHPTDGGPDRDGKFHEVRIELRASQLPRQGVNTCGANDVFIFDALPTSLPAALVYPLLGGAHFATKQPARGAGERFIFIPHDPITGRPLEAAVLKSAHRPAWDFLRAHEAELRARKGMLIASWIRRGYWWALLGVGPYSFAPYKVAWQALGSRSFRPIVVGADGRCLQGNQAMHAFVPCRSSEEAEATHAKLCAAEVQAFLNASRTGGTKNWAQPGRLKQIMRFTPEETIPVDAVR